MALKVGSRFNFWKTKPIFCLRRRVRCASLKEAKSTPSISNLPEGGRSDRQASKTA